MCWRQYSKVLPLPLIDNTKVQILSELHKYF